MTDTDNNAAEMPRYVSHKTVHALEIDTITNRSVQKTVLTFCDKGYAPIEASIEMFYRYQPVPGDFYVVYQDGYKSFSPRKAFLEGYTRESGGAPAAMQSELKRHSDPKDQKRHVKE